MFYIILLTVPSQDEINELRKDFSIFNMNDINYDRPVLEKENLSEEESDKSYTLEFYSFTGTKMNRTIELLLHISGITCSMNDRMSYFSIHTSKENFESVIKKEDFDIDEYIGSLLDIRPSILDFLKWGKFLPKPYQVSLVRNKYYDINNTIGFLKNVKLSTISIKNLY